MVQSVMDAQKVIGQVSAMAIVDQDFKSRLTAAPATVLREHGLELPEMPDFRIEIVASAADLPATPDGRTLHLLIPDADELSHEELAMVSGAAASCQSTSSTFCTIPSCGSCVSTASTNSCA